MKRLVLLLMGKCEPWPSYKDSDVAWWRYVSSTELSVTIDDQTIIPNSEPVAIHQCVDYDNRLATVVDPDDGFKERHIIQCVKILWRDEFLAAAIKGMAYCPTELDRLTKQHNVNGQFLLKNAFEEAVQRWLEED